MQFQGAFGEKSDAGVGQLEDAVLVVAHPDDEILWFSSILSKCKRVIVCFGPTDDPQDPVSVGRSIFTKSYPLQNVKFLQIPQSGIYQRFNWRKPEIHNGELHFRRRYSSYVHNSDLLAARLRVELAGEKLVFTHNPWGEYGNEEHVQIFNVVYGLHREQQFEVFVSAYVSNRSRALMTNCLRSLDFGVSSARSLLLKTNRMLAAELKAAYVAHHCWTWMPDYQWPSVEAFYPVGHPLESHDHCSTSSIPLNYVSYQFALSFLERTLSRLLPRAVKQKIRESLETP